MTTAENELLERIIQKIIHDNNAKIIRHINRAVKTAFREAVDELNNQENLNTKESCEYLRIGIQSFRKLVKSQKIKSQKVGKRKWIFKKEDLKKYLENNNSNT